MNCSDSQIPRSKSLFNQHDSSLGRHANTTPRESLETQDWVFQYTKNPFEAKNCMNSSFQLLLYIIKVKSQEDQ